MFQIGTATIDPPLLLAPMAGVTDRDFRQLIKKLGGAGLVTMEFVSSRAIVGGNPKAKELMAFDTEERPVAIQIYGSEASTMAEAARVVEDLGADICDINMGCPANKVLKGCAGAALMGDLPRAERIVASVRKVLSIPYTVKFRLGLDDSHPTFLELGRICEDNGAAAVTLHGRTARQVFRGEANWDAIGELKEELSIPVIGNGDVREPEDAAAMMDRTGCDGVMIGRGALKNPWILRQATGLLEGGSLPPPTLSDRRDLVLSHLRRLAELEPKNFALHKLRKFTAWYTHGLPNGRRLRRQINDLPDIERFLAAVESFFEELLLAEAA